MFEELQLQSGNNFARGPKHGPPLLFLHGVLRRWQDFTPLFPALTPRWHVHALDFRGHGSSNPGRSYRVADYVEDAVAFLQTQVDEPAVLYGHSLGAMVACGAAAAVPDRVRAIVLEDPPFETLGRDIRRTVFYTQFEGMRDALQRCSTDPDALARELAEIRLPTPKGLVRLGDLRDPTQLRFSASCLLKIDPAIFDPLLAGEWLDGYEVETVLTTLRCPTLLLAADWGAGGMMPPDLTDRVERLIPRCTRVDLKGIGHTAHWADLETVLKLTAGFLESLR